MRIVRAELFELSLPLVEPFVISGGTIASRRSLIVILHDDAGHAGYGECPPFELPFYSEETLAGARDLIERVLLPRVAGRDFDGPLPEGVDAALRDGVRGNWFARAAVETAAWDLEAHARGVGLTTLLGERLAVKPASAVDCGVALGIPPERRADVLTKWVYEAVQRGYRRVKIKVAPGWDIAAVAAGRAGRARAASSGRARCRNRASDRRRHGRRRPCRCSSIRPISSRRAAGSAAMATSSS